MRLLIIASVLSIAYAQLRDLPLTTPKPWKGPIADHKIGIHPSDTPEVAAAKAQHLTAYRQVLNVLPVLPAEERFIEGNSPSIAGLQKESHPSLTQVQHIQFLPAQTHAPHFQQSIVLNANVRNPVVTPSKPGLLAEEIPRSALGEVPEVAAAREAHLKAHETARRLLPKIPPM